MRDFVHVSDVARANVLALERVVEAGPDSFAAYNIGSGHPVSIAGVAEAVAATVGGVPPVTTGEFRPGDVRHIVASSQRAADDLGFVAQVGPEAGLADFATAPLR
jgi:dTDP-L-rhamnose 4-epimerase